VRNCTRLELGRQRLGKSLLEEFSIRSIANMDRENVSDFEEEEGI
jgi:hypothetical protein